MPAQCPVYQGICQLLPRALVVSTLAYKGGGLDLTQGFCWRVPLKEYDFVSDLQIQHQGQLSLGRTVKTL